MKLFASIALVLGGCLMPIQPGAQQPSGGGGYYGGQPMGGTTPADPNANANASASSPSSPSSAPSRQPPAEVSVVSVTIRSECAQTVKVFYGDKPKFGSGRTSSISSHSQEHHTFRPGEMFWIIDDGENGVASVTVTASMREITIADGCTMLGVH